MKYKKYARILCFVLCIALLFSSNIDTKIFARTFAKTFAESNQSNKGQENPVQDTVAQKDTAQNGTTQDSAAVDITSESAVLIEGSTGTVIYEKNKDEKRKPASITKIMTLLLIFDALASGKIKLTDQVTVSEYAASMGGSQVYLEPGETQDVNTMLKCISIASANDAAVAMAEYIAGSEESFVNLMNERAKGLGMNNTHFVNCCGLDVDNHYTTAYDIALMSRELITKYPQISDYSTVWMENITHTTRKGQSEFGLTNTNKLIKSYNGITGLKTGSTSLAKYCLSATAKRNGMDMIAVVLAAPETKIRFREAAKLLDYGFANCSIYQDDNKDLAVSPIPVRKGVADGLNYRVNDKFSYLCLKGTNPADITKKVTVDESVTAPVKENDKVGEVTYQLAGKTIGKVDIVAAENINKANLKDYFKSALRKYLF